MDTSLVRQPARRIWFRSAIVAFLATVVTAWLAGSAPQAQAKHPRGKKKAAAEKAEKNAPPPKVSLSPTARRSAAPLDEKAQAKQAAQIWSRLTAELDAEYRARAPEQALERDWPEGSMPHLGTYGSRATLRWRNALTSALAELDSLEALSLPGEAGAQIAALDARVEAELLLLEARAPSTSDPVGYVQRISRALRTAAGAAWLPAERRQELLVLLLGEVPDSFRDARTSLVDPCAQWIDLALLELDDLLELLIELEQSLPKDSVAKAPKAGQGASAPRAALEGFRSWLLELRPSAGFRPPGPDAGQWQRLVRLRSGTSWSASEIKSSCLRELGQLDLAARQERAGSGHPSGVQDLAQQAWDASALALQVGVTAHLLHKELAPEAVEFALEASSRMRPELAWLRPSGAGSVRVSLGAPHGSWRPEQALTRKRCLQDARAALGVRYGLAGESLWALESRACKNGSALLLDNRLLQEGLGLFALDWVSRVDWIENPFRVDGEERDDAQALAFDFQRGLEAARLVAAIELHAEGLSLEEAVQGLQRRTGVDRDTARAEALTAQRDPLHGLGYLGLIELRALEQRLARLTSARKGLQLCLLLAASHPDLRPMDMTALAGDGTPPVPKEKRMTPGALEKPAGAQQEVSR